MVPISEGKGDPGKGLVRGGGGCQFTPVTHVLVFMATGVWSPGGGKKKKTKNDVWCYFRLIYHLELIKSKLIFIFN